MKNLSSAQCHCARVLLKWDQAELARRCGLHVQTICLFETEQSTPTKRTLEKISTALENAGIEFTDGDGVKKQTGEVRHYKGQSGLIQFMDDVYDCAKSQGGKMYFYNIVPQNWLDALGDAWWQHHVERMIPHKSSNDIRILVPEGTTNLISRGYAVYKWFPHNFKLSGNRSIYVYGNKLGFVQFEKETSDLEIMVLHNLQFAEDIRVLFEIAWDNVSIYPPNKQNEEK